MISLYPAEPGYKRRDTSEAAAKSMTVAAKALEDQIMNLLQAGDYTPDEVATMICKDKHNVRSRFSELAERQLIFDSGKRRQNVSGRPAIVWTTRKQGDLL